MPASREPGSALPGSSAAGGPKRLGKIRQLPGGAVAQESDVARHFADVRGWRVKLSDADAFNWTMIEALSILAFLLVLARVAYMPGLDTGTIFAIFVYVWRLMEKLDMLPQIVQQLMRLKDIRRRIEAAPTVETDKKESPLA